MNHDYEDPQSLPAGQDYSQAPEEAADGFGGANFGAGAFVEAAPKARVSAQTVILLVIAVVAGGLLFGMRSFGMGTTVDALTQVTIDYEPDQQAEALRKEAEEVIAELDRSQAPAQIPVAWIERNPFVLVETEEEEVETAATTDQPDASAVAMARVREEVTRAMDRIELGSIVGGRVPVARVNGEMLQIGDKVDGVLTIQAIEGRIVEFKGDDGRVFHSNPDGGYTEVGTGE